MNAGREFCTPRFVRGHRSHHTIRSHVVFISHHLRSVWLSSPHFVSSFQPHANQVAGFHQQKARYRVRTPRAITVRRSPAHREHGPSDQNDDPLKTGSLTIRHLSHTTRNAHRSSSLMITSNLIKMLRSVHISACCNLAPHGASQFHEFPISRLVIRRCSECGAPATSSAALPA